MIKRVFVPILSIIFLISYSVITMGCSALTPEPNFIDLSTPTALHSPTPALASSNKDSGEQSNSIIEQTPNPPAQENAESTPKSSPSASPDNSDETVSQSATETADQANVDGDDNKAQTSKGDTLEPTPTIPQPSQPYQFNSRFSLNDDSEGVPPSVIKNELQFVAVGGPPPAFWCWLQEPGTLYSEPTIVERFTTLDERPIFPPYRSLPQFTPSICTCGYEENETLNVSLHNPAGEKLLDIDVTSQSARYIDAEEIFSFCYTIYEITEFDFLPGELLGDYTVEISSRETRLVHSFTLLDSNSPTVYYSNRRQGFIIANFEPLEKVWALEYEHRGSSDKARFTKGGRFSLDENGIGMVTDANPEATLVVVRENFDTVTTRDLGNYKMVVPPIDYNKIIEYAPTNPDVYYQRAKNGELLSAWYQDFEYHFDPITDLTKAIELDPNFILAYLERGLKYSAQENYDQAIADFSKVIALDSNSATAYIERGLAYKKQGDYNAALSDLSRAINLDLENISLYQERVEIYESQQRDDEATADYGKIIELSPDDALAYCVRAQIYNRQGKHELAIADLTKGIELGGGCGINIDDLNQLIEASPDFALAYHRRGGIFRQKKQYDQAIADFSKAIELDSNLADAYSGRAVAYKEKGILDEAVADLTKAIAIEPDNRGYYRQRGELFISLGKTNEAIADFELYLEREPDVLMRDSIKARLNDLKK